MSAPPSNHKGQKEDDEEKGGGENHNSSNNHKDELTPSLSAAANNDDDDDDVAVDDSDLPDDVVEIQKTISNERRCRQNKEMLIQDLLPFPFSPLIRPLTISDLESCIALENAAFGNPAHRCSRDKFMYRLTQCPELCMGLFCTVVPSKTGDWDIETLHTAHPVETGRNDGAVSVLLAHVIATRSRDEVVTDDAMDYPRDYKVAKNSNGDRPRVGHQDTGRTFCIHSLAVHPKLQGVGMGQLILKACMRQVKNSELADRIALICEEYLANYYKRFGFSHLGPSKATFSGGGWHDMVFDLGAK
ncbi:hypothetical protein F4680DRAFT_444171 [Xylaria scruposa]|nr:hypothetical protein F4680DRAFT_444171 [Xylaria scruposa]